MDPLNLSERVGLDGRAVNDRIFNLVDAGSLPWVFGLVLVEGCRIEFDADDVVVGVGYKL